MGLCGLGSGVGSSSKLVYGYESRHPAHFSGKCLESGKENRAVKALIDSAFPDN